MDDLERLQKDGHRLTAALFDPEKYYAYYGANAYRA